ncbi:GNAT family N-acetyltransferase [Fibrobacter sp. UWR2]|uniref:GNAT family N-acetyltransferase n=1 Tax=Fibrobacter sp. UWR2 TaxID=1964352 RepID=UPI000B5200C1|nr:GNAT family protein [Fibrobacter sp. UWR2]OWV00726.1 GNAT family N-acetyltransferase [Fibrobacter sp. UWR2]
MEDFLTEIPDIAIEGERVTLRLLHGPDAPALYPVIDGSREFLARHLPWPAECTSVEDVESRIDTWEIQADMANGACWGIFEKGADSLKPTDSLKPVLAGVIMLGWIQAQHRSASVSYWLGEPFTGRGLATEALRLLARHAFTELGLNRLDISASVNNPASIAVATRAGFLPEGTCREYEFINGHFEDHLRFSRLAKDR